MVMHQLISRRINYKIIWSAANARLIDIFEILAVMCSASLFRWNNFRFEIPNVTNVAPIADQKGVNSASATKIEDPSPTAWNNHPFVKV